MKKISKPPSLHTFRDSLGTHLLEDGYNISTVQVLLGHRDVSTTMVYTHSSIEGVERSVARRMNLA